MMTVEYELWLDESGDFFKESIGQEVPSMVGGILIPAGSLSQEQAKKFLDDTRGNPTTHLSDWVHSTDIRGMDFGFFSVKLLTLLVNQGYRLIVFENQQRVSIVNSDLTYLHILSEGIIQLLQTLSMEEEHITLHIIAANRNRTADSDKNYIERINKEEYVQRLQEKMDLGLARRNLTLAKWNWTFTLHSARVDQRLMLADVVCHSWFRRNSKKFGPEQQKEIKKLYNTAYCFSALEHATVGSIKRKIADGSVGDALYEWLLTDEKEYTGWHLTIKTLVASESRVQEDVLLETLINRLKQLPDFAQKTQLSIIINNLKSLIQLDRNFKKAKRMLVKLQTIVIPAIELQGVRIAAFDFEIQLMLFTNATHQGDVFLAELQMNEGRKRVGDMAGRWEDFDLILNFFVREAVHLMNTYDFSGVIQRMDQLVRFIDSTIELFPLALQDELSLQSRKMNSDIRGKVVGTRLQARNFLLRQQAHQINLAREDFDTAIAEFCDKSDIIRQYQYRSQTECEAGEYNQALEWLAESLDLSRDAAPSTITSSLLRASKGTRVFGLMHYMRLVGQAALDGHADFADHLFRGLQESGAEQEMITELETSDEHPYEIISWKLASYMMSKGNVKAASKRYLNAIQICQAHPEHWTLRSIGLGISAEYVSLLIVAGGKYSGEARKARKQLIDEHQKFMLEKLPPKMSLYFKEWEEALKSLPKLTEEAQSEMLYKLSRGVSY